MTYINAILSNDTMEILENLYDCEATLDAHIEGIKVLDAFFAIGKHFGENCGEIPAWVRAGMPAVPKITDFDFDLQLFSDEIEDLKARKAAAVVELAELIGVNIANLEVSTIRSIKANDVIVVATMHDGKKYFSQTNGIKGAVTKEQSNIIDKIMFRLKSKAFYGEEQLMKLFMSCSKYMANKSIAVVSSKFFFEDTIHEQLTRDNKAYNVTAIRLSMKEELEKIEFSSRKEEYSAIKKFFDNIEKGIKNPSDLKVSKKEAGDGKNHLYKIKMVPIATRLLQPCDFTRKASLLPIEPADVAIGNKEETIVQSVKRYSKAFIMIEVEDKESLPYVAEKEGDTCVPRVFYRWGSGKNEKWIVEDPFNNEKVINLFTGKTFDKKVFLEKYADKCLHYNVPNCGIAGISAGQTKKFALPSPCNNLQGLNWKKVFNDLSYGAFEIVLDGKTKNPKAVAQAAVRFSLADAPAKELGSIGNFAVYMGKFTDKTEPLAETMARGRKTCVRNRDNGFDNNDVVIVPSGNESLDGLGFWAAEHAAQAFSKIDRFQYTVDTVEGAAAQMRPYNCKTLAAIVRREAINYTKRNYGTGTIVLVRGEITEEQQHFFDMCFTDEAGNSPYWEKNVILCDRDDNISVDFYTDLNGLKMTFDLNRRSTCNVLGISSQHKSLKSGSTISGQLIASLSCVDPEATRELISEHADEFIKEKVSSIGFKKDENGEWIHEIPGVSENIAADLISGDLDVGNLASRIFPTMTEHLFSVYKRIADKTIEGMITAANENKITTQGTYCKVVVDYTLAIATRKVLGVTKEGYVECYAPAMTKAGVKKAIGVKYPKMGINEFGKFVNVSLDVIQNRLAKLIDKGKITEEIAETIFKIFRNTSAGVIVIPAVEILKNLLAGMDFDGDAIQLYFNSKIVDILWNVDPVAVKINKKGLNTKADGTANVLSKDVALNNFYNFVSSNNANVGQVTVCHYLGIETVVRLSKFYNILSEKDSDKISRVSELQETLDIIKKTWSDVFDVDIFEEDSSPKISKEKIDFIFDEILEKKIVDNVVVHEINYEKIKKFLRAVALMNKENLVLIEKAARCFMEIGRFFQELTIDSAKTAESIEIPYLETIFKKIHMVSRQNSKDLFNVEILWNGISDIEKTYELNEERTEMGNKGFEGWKLSNIRYKTGKNYRYIWYNGEDTVFKNKNIEKNIIVDEAHRLRVMTAEKIVKLCSVIPEHKQTITPEFIKFITEKTKGFEKYFSLVGYEINKFRSITTAKDEDVKKIRQLLRGQNCEVAESKIKNAKKVFDPFFTSIADTVRAAMKSVEPSVRAAIAFRVQQETNKQGGNKLSSFVQDILKEEFVLLMLEAQKAIYGIEAPKVTAKVLNCTYEEGSVVEFKNGVGISDGGKCVLIDKVSGIFSVVKDDKGHWTAEADLADVLKTKIPKATDNTRCYMTVANAECDAAADNAFRKLKVGTKATIVPYNYKGKMKVLSNSIIVNEEELTHYVGSTTEKESRNILDKTYGFLEGKVGFAYKYKKNFEGKKYNTILFTLEDVKSVNSYAIQKMEIKPLKVDILKEEEVTVDKKAKRESLRNKLFVSFPEPKKEMDQKLNEDLDGLLKELGIEPLKLDIPKEEVAV